MLALGLLLTGCVQFNVVRQNNLAMTSLSVGMTKDEFFAAMGPHREFRVGQGRIVTNPYKVEQAMHQDGRLYEIIWYITGAGNVYDFDIYEKDLTPFVVIDGKLAGWGWSFYRSKW